MASEGLRHGATFRVECYGKTAQDHPRKNQISILIGYSTKNWLPWQISNTHSTLELLCRFFSVPFHPILSLWPSTTCIFLSHSRSPRNKNPKTFARGGEKSLVKSNKSFFCVFHSCRKEIEKSQNENGRWHCIMFYLKCSFNPHSPLPWKSPGEIGARSRCLVHKKSP